jgi:hypothetical protein
LPRRARSNAEKQIRHHFSKKLAAMAAPAMIDTSRLVLQDTVTSQKGARQIPLANRDGSQVTWQPAAMQCLWQPSAYNDENATRLNLSLSPGPEAEACLEALDEWLVNALALESSRRFGTQMSAEEVRSRYQSALKTHEASGTRYMRVKVNMTGKAAVRCWDSMRQQRSPPESWTSCSVTPRIVLKGVWLMGKDFGLTLDLRDAMLDEQPTECPF